MGNLSLFCKEVAKVRRHTMRQVTMPLGHCGHIACLILCATFLGDVPCGHNTLHDIIDMSQLVLIVGVLWRRDWVIKSCGNKSQAQTTSADQWALVSGLQDILWGGTNVTHVGFTDVTWLEQDDISWYFMLYAYFLDIAFSLIWTLV